MLIYDRVLSEAERLAVEAYLSAKYELDTPPAPPKVVDVFRGGVDGYPVFRIPSIVCLPAGRLLAFAEGRGSSADNGANDMVARYSNDHGATWGPTILVDDQAGRSLNNPCAVVLTAGPNIGRIILMYQSYSTGCGEGCAQPGNVGDNICKTFTKYSDDGGATWSATSDVTAQVKRPLVVTSVATGPGIGIQLRHGAHPGRIIMPFNQDPAGTWACYAAYSDDFSASWRYGDIAANGSPGTGNEVQMVERVDGLLMLNSRQFGGGGWRKTAVSTNAGQSWSSLINDDELPCPSCMAGLVALTDPADGFSESRLVYCGPDSTSSRSMGTVWLSKDGGVTWPTKKLLYPGGYAYSLPVWVDCDRFGVFFERDGYTKISLIIEDYEGFTSGADSYSGDGPCAPPPPCPADLDHNGVVNGTDLTGLMGAWGTAGSPADFDGSGQVDAADLTFMLGAWGTCA